jgi:hypothetical protein
LNNVQFISHLKNIIARTIQGEPLTRYISNEIHQMRDAEGTGEEEFEDRRQKYETQTIHHKGLQVF